MHMKTTLTFVLLLVTCTIIWTASVGLVVQSNSIPFADRDAILSSLVFGVPALFTIAMGTVGFRAAKSQNSLRRILAATAWSLSFAAVCWFVFFLAVLPAYFRFGGTL